MTNVIPYTQPVWMGSAFNCPYCKAYADQAWFDTYFHSGMSYQEISAAKMCVCGHCKKYSIWHAKVMMYPDFSGAEPPNDDLGEKIKMDYYEAASITQKSPRGAAALLRLVIQKLCIQLGEGGKDLNKDIGNLVKKGLPVKVQQSLDTLRVVGNEAVHPGELDLRDDTETVDSLFKLVNFIAEKLVTEPKEIEEIYNKIPENKKKQINERDKQ